MKWIFLIILGYIPLSAGACGGRDQYDTSGLTLDECMENCIQRDDCSAVAFRENSCGIHQGVIRITSGGWTKGYSCYEKHRKIPGNLPVVIFSVYLIIVYFSLILISTTMLKFQYPHAMME